MKQQLNHFPILILFLCIFISCEKKQSNAIVDKHVEYRDKALSFESQSHYDSAYFYYNKAKSLTTKSEDRHAYVLLKLAQIQQIIGDYYGCEETITEALATHKNSNYLPYFYNLLAISYHKQNDLESAIEFYKKAVDLTLNSFEKGIIQNNIGLVYLEKKEYQKAIETLQPLLNDSTLATDQYEIARVLDNLGYTQLQLKKTNAFKNLFQAWTLRDSLQDNLGLIASNMHLSEYYQSKNSLLAKEYAQRAFDVAQKANSPDDQLEALKWLTEFGDPNESKRYYQYYIRLNDSLTKARSIAKNQFTKIKYDSKKATQEVIKYKNQKSLLLALLGLIVVIAILLYKLYQIKNKRKLQQATYVTETRISKRIHDELANDVFNAMTFTQTQNLENPITKEALLDNLEHIYQRTRDISKENSDIRTDENYEPDLFQMIDGYGDSNLNVILKINEPIHWQKITPEKKITLQRVIQEFLINTKKHSEATVVIIDFSEDKKNITVNYTDNGIGIKNTQQRKSGLQNAENRILAIQGSFTFDQTIQKGFKVTVVIPK
jgi:signal transduction histidine kinase